MKPSVGRVVHYVSYGTPDGEYTSQCRAAIVTAVESDTEVSLFVMNPTGLFLNETALYDAGTGQPGDPACPNRPTHGKPFRYCGCGFSDGGPKGGSWHWPERVE